MSTVRRVAPVMLIAVIGAAGSAAAEGIPVYDYSNTMQNIEQVANQLQQLQAMADDYAAQIEQLTNLVQQTAAMTGPRNMGQLLNGQFESDMRRYLPDELGELLDLTSASGSAIAGAQRVFQQLYDDYDPVLGAELDPADPTGPLALSTDRLTNTTYASLAASEQAYDNVGERVQMIEAMLDRLNATTDLKESIDLQARISAEQAFIQSEMMRLQTIQMQARGAELNERLVRLREAQRANAFDPNAEYSAIR